MIFIDSREQEVGHAFAQGSKLPCQSALLPVGDYWITPWPQSFTWPTNLGEFMAMAQSIRVPLAQILTSIKADEGQLLTEAQSLAARWIASQSLVIERKTPSDFLNTLRGGRLGPQAMAMLQYPAHARLFVITGYLTPTKDDKLKCEGTQYNWNYWSVMLQLSELAASGLPTLFVPAARFSEYIQRLAAWYRKEHPPVPPPPVHSLVPLSNAAAFLCGIEGVGPKLALKVLEQANNNPAQALVMLTNRATLVDGKRPERFGPERLRRIRQFLGINEEEQLALVKRELP